MARVGIDLVSVGSVRASLDHGTRYLERVYPEAEVGACRGAKESLRSGLPRGSVKEAKLKVLRPRLEQAIPWRTIEVVSQLSGWLELKLIGPAATATAAAGLSNLARGRLCFSRRRGR